jgi:hypothetical protein
MRISPSVILVSGEINFNFGRSVFFLSKSEVKISQFVSLKTRDFTVYERRGLKKSAKHFFTKYGNTHDCSSQRRGLALQHMVLCFPFFLERFRYTLCISDRTTLVVWVKTDTYHTQNTVRQGQPLGWVRVRWLVV